MTHRFSLPTDAELEKLITQVYESMPSPDQSRLSLIESKLLQKARKNKDQNNLNKIPWWIVLLLAGGLATAAWWASEAVFDKDDAIMEDEKHIFNEKLIDNQTKSNETESSIENNESYKDRDSPVIYQRESF
ncbi:MAG: hypothetical protein HND53_06830 [Proteobacteria bacterium]|nr:hypothetical protein [Pseudomonadota bacterium]NOG60199.1 hypothetical protein [Pseudomonadota bacterium]